MNSVILNKYTTELTIMPSKILKYYIFLFFLLLFSKIIGLKRDW